MQGNVVIVPGQWFRQDQPADSVQWLLLSDVPRLEKSVLKKDEDYIRIAMRVGRRSSKRISPAPRK